MHISTIITWLFGSFLFLGFFIVQFKKGPEYYCLSSSSHFLLCFNTSLFASLISYFLLNTFTLPSPFLFILFLHSLFHSFSLLLLPFTLFLLFNFFFLSIFLFSFPFFIPPSFHFFRLSFLLRSHPLPSTNLYPCFFSAVFLFPVFLSFTIFFLFFWKHIFFP